MRVEEIEKLSRKELRARANESFALAEEKGPGYLAQADFYVRELAHRYDSWVSIRDFILEVVVIALIGWEIHLAIKQGNDEDIHAGKQMQVLQQIGTTMATEEDTMRAMDTRIRTQLARMSQINVAPDINLTNKTYALVNYSATEIQIWGRKFGSEGAVFFSTPTTVGRSKTGSIPADALVKAITDPERQKDGLWIPVVVYLTDDIGNKFTWHAEHLANWTDGRVNGTMTRNDKVTMEEWAAP